MDDIKPKFLCTSCMRGVLNRSAERCLYCGAALPAGVRLSSAAIATRETADVYAREKERQDWVQQNPQPQSEKLEGLGDVIDLLGDL